MILTEEYRIPLRKPEPVPQFPPQIPHVLTGREPRPPGLLHSWINVSTVLNLSAEQEENCEGTLLRQRGGQDNTLGPK